MAFLMPLVVMSALLARAAGPDEPVADPLVITTAGGTFTVTHRTAPPPARLERDDRTCIVGLRWSPGGTEVTPRDCPEPVVPDVVRTVSQWTVHPAPSEVPGPTELGELWFVYPFDAEDSPLVLVRQSHDRTLSLPPDINVVPYAISAWSFVRYPRAAHRDGVPDVSCVVQIRADTRGLTTDVRVDGCGDPYREAARTAITAWRFDPPVIHGEPIPSALTLRTTFVSEGPVDDEPFEPSEESQRLWAERQFELLSRDERIRFIEAALLGDNGRDLGPGQVRVALPAVPDLGGRPPPSFFEGESDKGEVRPLPDHPPILIVGKVDHLGVEVYELGLPTSEQISVEHRARCPLLVQVDGDRRVISWAEESCDPDVRSLALTTADDWLLRHDGPPVHSARARFEATLVFDPDGSSHVVFPRDEIRSPEADLPAMVRTYRDAKPVDRVPPRIPRDLALPDAECTLAVRISRAGRPQDVRVETCPPGFEEASIRAVRHWRWRPAEEDGVPVEADTEVTIRFSP